MPDHERTLHPETLAVVGGSSTGAGPLAPGIATSTTWASESLDDANARATGTRRAEFYSRYANPTVAAFEEAVAGLEGAEAALAAASGMGAMSSTLFALCSSGDHVVAQHQLYGGTRVLLQGHCARFGIEVTFVDATRPGAFSEAVIPGRTMLVIAETPSNPRLDLVDLDELGAVRGPFTLVDSTFATPVGQRPLDHGVDLVVHSATKGIAGHNDATVGVVAGSGELIDAIWAYAVLHGATASPFDAHLALRGLRTLPVRYERQCQTAHRLAESLGTHLAVTTVHHPLLAGHPQHELARTQFSSGGTMLAIELGGGEAAARSMLSALRLARVATSLGGPDTLVCHPATSTHAGLGPQDQAICGVTPGLVRISVGLEHHDDVLADLRQALDAAVDS
jgi:cystathionine beta-lyase/cystathionine gamma-synthase